MLAKQGPWTKHTRVKSLDAMNEAVMWLARQGKAENIDYEILIQDIQHKNAKITVILGKGGIMISPQPIMFFNDAGLASYVKLTWG